MMKNFKILSTGLNLTTICYNISLTILIYQKINKAPVMLGGSRWAVMAPFYFYCINFANFYFTKVSKMEFKSGLSNFTGIKLAPQ